MEDSPYIKALEKQREVVNDWAELLNDPYKAPELKVGLPSSVFNSVVEVIAERNLLDRKELPMPMTELPNG